jgi:hypothetical protein
MEIEFRPTEEDALNALRATSMPGWGMLLFVLLLTLLALVGIYLIDHDFPVAGGIWLGLSAPVGLAVYEIPKIQVRRGLRRNPSAQGEVVYRLDDEGILVTFPTGESRLDWRAYTKYKETEAVFLLFFSPDRYSAIPKRVLSTKQIDELRGLLKSRIAVR